MSSADDCIWRAAVKANLDRARRRRGRLGLPKSRSGCATCKARRIKCTEERPECSRCGSSGRRCGGYNQHGANNQDDYSASLSLVRLAFEPDLRDQEKHIYSYFSSETAPRLGQSLDKEFWCRHVLRIAHHEPIILDSLLAISTLYRYPQFIKSFRLQDGEAGAAENVSGVAHPAFAPLLLDPHHTTALMHYNRAMKGFSDKMNDGTATPMLALLTCTLFYCIETIRDNVFGGISLFMTGATLMRQFSSCPEGMDLALYDVIRQTFARIAVAAALMGHPAEHDVEEWAGKFTHDPDACTDITQARTMLFRLLGETHATLRLTGSYQRAQHVYEDNSSGMPAFPSNALTDHELQQLPPPPPRPHELPDRGYRTHMGTWYENLHESAVEDSICDESIVLGAMSEDLYDMALHHGDITSEQRMVMKLGDRQIPCDPLSLRRRYQETCLRLSSWLQAFRRMYPSRLEEDHAAAALLLQYQFAKISMTACPAGIEQAFDDCKSGFEEILRLSEIYIARTENTTFTFEIGTVPALYFTTMKCRIPSLRRRALRLLLRAPAKEAMWGSRSVAEVGARLIAIEEEGLDHPDPCNVLTRDPPPDDGYIDDSSLPPEHQRVHNVGIVVDKIARCYKLRVTRYPIYDETGTRIKVLSDHPI